LVFSTSLFHSFLFPINSFQFFTFSTCISLRIPSIHLFLDLPAGLFQNGFQLVSYLTILSSSILLCVQIILVDR
jgi:hypothetical protein